MSYPWYLFTVWFTDGYTGVYQASGLGVTDAFLSLCEGFARDNPELMAECEQHGDIMRVQFEADSTWMTAQQQKQATKAALDAAKGMQADFNRILKVEQSSTKPEELNHE